VRLAERVSESVQRLRGYEGSRTRIVNLRVEGAIWRFEEPCTRREGRPLWTADIDRQAARLNIKDRDLPDVQANEIGEQSELPSFVAKGVREADGVGQ
jgi:hypothetical protein